jgi:hypothetical protein
MVDLLRHVLYPRKKHVSHLTSAARLACSSTYARIVSQEKTRKSPDLGHATSVQFVEVAALGSMPSVEISKAKFRVLMTAAASNTSTGFLLF